MRDLKISEVMDLVERAIPYTPENYPELGKRLAADPKHCQHQKMAFAFGHALLHETKAAAVIATVLEKFEHGDTNAFLYAQHELKRAIVKLFGNTARLFEIANLAPDEITDMLENEFKSQ